MLKTTVPLKNNDTERKTNLSNSNRNNEEELEDTREVIRVPKSKDRQRNGQEKKDKRTNNDLQSTTQKIKQDEHTLKTGCELRVAVSVPRVAPVVLLLRKSMKIDRE